MNIKPYSRRKLATLGFSVIIAILASAAPAHAQFGGGQRGGGGMSGGGLGGGGGGFSGGGASGSGFLGQGNGFRANSGTSSGGYDPFSSSRGNTALGMMGGQQYGGGMSGMNMGMNMGMGNRGGMSGMGMSGMSALGTGGRISTIALQGSLRPVPVISAEVTVRIQQIMENATGVKGGRDITITEQGEETILNGTVRNERERKLAESMLLLEPGVREVRNELKVGAAPPGPGS